jgi:hypothetical protein
VGDLAKQVASAPYQLSKELHYLTPPPPWWIAGACRGQRGQPDPGVVGGVSRSEVSVATGETAQGPLADATPIASALPVALLAADAGQASRKPKLLVRPGDGRVGDRRGAP